MRRQGYRGADAEDLTQAYFERFLERGDLEYAATWQGRLEVFLRVSVRYFLSNERDRERAKKRGGGQCTALARRDARPRARRAGARGRDTPETLLAQARATGAIEDALSAAAVETERAGGSARLARVEQLPAERGQHRQLPPDGDEWGVGESAVRVVVHRLRRRLARLLRLAVRAGLREGHLPVRIALLGHRMREA